MSSEHKGMFRWFPPEDGMPGQGLIVGDDIDPDTGNKFNVNVSADATFGDGIDLTKKLKKMPVWYTSRKVPTLPVYHALTVRKQ